MIEERRHDAQYIEDSKYIHATLERTVANVDKLFAKFEKFKVDNAKSITTIEIKLKLSSLIGSGIFSLIFAVVSGIVVYYFTKGM